LCQGFIENKIKPQDRLLTHLSTLLRQLSEVILKIFSTIFSKAMGSSEAIGFGHVGLAGMRGF
jgi:hypothetical protein